MTVVHILLVLANPHTTIKHLIAAAFPL